MSALREQTLDLIAGDDYRTACLRTLAGLKIPQAAIAAGFVRNAIWDAIFSRKTELVDIDVVYFDPGASSVEAEANYERMLATRMPAKWQVRNQARMHLRNGVAPYSSAKDAVSRYPELATCLSMQLDVQGYLRMPNQQGLGDAWSGVVRPNPRLSNAVEVVRRRVEEKCWLRDWPGLILDFPSEE